MPIHLINQTLDSVTIHNLKHIRDLDLDFRGNRVTGIFGVNGCGKSSILHALACFYRSLNAGSESNYFTRFFKRIGNEAWKDSKITAIFTIEGVQKTVVYKKGKDRWIPRMDSKPKRDTFYVGIDSCVPAIEKEPLTRTSFHMANRGSIDNHDEVIDAFSNIMCRTYDAAEKEAFLKKQYTRVRLHDAASYTSLSMGAGEQRLLYLIELLYHVPEYSLVLIDELDLTLHTLALQRLVDLIVDIADEKHLQVVFTSHREELTKRYDINIRHIWQPANVEQTFCLNRTTPDCICRLTGVMEKQFEVYVEDLLASCIVKEVLKDAGILSFTKVIIFGDAGNAFSIAAGLELQGQVDNKKLILLDGDVYTTNVERIKQIKKKIGGTEVGKDAIRNHAITIIKQLILPAGEQPEHYIWSLLKTKQGELANYANMVNLSPDDKHHYLYDIYQMQGEDMGTYFRNVVKAIKGDAAWTDYVKEVTDWIAGLNI